MSDHDAMHSACMISPKEEVSIEQLLVDLFGAMDKAKIDWVVLRNAEGLPKYTRNDVDFLVPPSQEARSIHVVREVAARNGWQTIGTYGKRNYHAILLMSPGASVRFLLFDFYTAFEFRAHRYFNTAVALASRRKNENGIWVMRPGFTAALRALKELLPLYRIKESARREIQAGAAQDPEGFLQVLGNVTVGQPLLDACQQADWQQVATLAARVRREVCRFRWTYPIFFFDYLWRYAAYHFSRNVSAMVVFVAPDGSGKTTIIEGLIERMIHRPFHKSEYLRSNFGILPELKRFKVLLGRLVGKKVTLVPPPPPGTLHAGINPAFPPMRSMCYVLYYAMDLFLGRLKLRRLRTQWTLIAFDRYYYDYYFQAAHRRCPRWFLNLVGLLVPKPDLAVFIDRDAQDIYRAKPELTVDEIERQQAEMRQFMGQRSYGTIVDGNSSIEATVDQVVAEVLRVILRRAEHNATAERCNAVSSTS